MINAEDNGITQANVDELRANPKTPAMSQLLGVTLGMGLRLGLKEEALAYKTVKSLGDFGEIWDRNLGKNSPYKLERGMNALWRNGGQFTPYWPIPTYNAQVSRLRFARVKSEN